MVARAGDRGILVGVACAVAIALVAWPVHSLEPGVGADWSWIATLNYAAEHGLRFGERIAWSYGPLGFLGTLYGPLLYYGDLLLLSWLYTLLLQLLLAAALLVSLRRSFSLPLAAVAAVVVLALVPDLAAAIGLVWCALVLARPPAARGERLAAAFPFAIGVLTGLTLLSKANEGIELLALALVALIAVPRRRDALAFAASLLAALAVGWFATGQTVADAWPYVRYGVEIVGGYAAAMGTSDSRGWTYAAAAALIALAFALAWDGTRGAAPARRRGLVALVAVYSAFTFKEGFVRQDTLHLEVFFGDIIVLFAALPLRAWRRPVAVAAILAGCLALGGVVGWSHLTRRIDIYRNTVAAADQVRTLASAGRRRAMVEDLRGRIGAGYGVTQEIVEAVGRRPVMLWPFLFGDIAWAYGFDLRPLPSLEPYSAYTSALDRHAADMLASSTRAPQRIMRANTPALDERYGSFEAPLAALAIFCRYRPIATAEPWQVLARAPNRCGAPRPLGVQSAPWGAAVSVPAPRRADALVLVRVAGADVHGLEQLAALALRPHRRWIQLDGTSYRLVAATAADGLLLSAPARLDYPAPFAMAPDPSQIAVGRDGGEPGGSLTYRFEEVPIGRFGGGVASSS